MAISAPGLTRLLKPYAKRKNYDLEDDDLEKIVEVLKKDRYFKVINKNNKRFLQITNRGRRKFIEYNIDTIYIKKQVWDKIWRLVIFDIPEKYKIARGVLRAKLKEIGFYKLQKSVWICPFECEKEINFIATVYHVEKYVNYIEASKIDTESSLRTHFNL